MFRLKPVFSTLIVAGLINCIAREAGAQSSAGVVHYMRSTTPSFDTYTNSPSTTTEQWMNQHFWRMLEYSPYFDSRLSWFPNAFVYIDTYAIYTGSALVSQHPEWILKDANGNRLFIPWGCSNGTCPQYAADTSNPAYQQYWISQAAAIMAGAGYKGIFCDDVNMEFRVSDGNSNFVDPIDPNTGTAMTWDNWRSYMAGFMEQVRSSFPNTEIVHNSIWYAGPAGINDQDPYIQRQIKAANYQYVEFGVTDGGLTGGTGFWSLNSLLGYMDRLHTDNQGVIIGGMPLDTAGREYAVANYYLVSAGHDSVADVVSTPDNWWAGFNVNLGSPSGARTMWNNLLRRDFAGGIVLVNPPQSAAVTVTLPATYKRVDGTQVTSVTLQAGQGVVLQGTSTASSPLPAPTGSLAVNLTYPVGGSFPRGTALTIYATASYATAVKFYVDGWYQVGPEIVWGGPYYSATWNTGSLGGHYHTLTAVARDSAGHTVTSGSVQVYIP